MLSAGGTAYYVVVNISSIVFAIFFALAQVPWVPDGTLTTFPVLYTSEQSQGERSRKQVQRTLTGHTGSGTLGPHGKQYPQSSSRPLCNPIIQCQGYLSLHHLCCIQIKGQRYTYSHTAPHQHLNCQCLPLATHCTLRPSNTRRNITPVLKYPAITNQGKGYLQHTAH